LNSLNLPNSGVYNIQLFESISEEEMKRQREELEQQLTRERDERIAKQKLDG
jgi:hypothetical protein